MEPNVDSAPKCSDIYNFQLGGFKQTKAFCNVYINLRIARGADGERALLLFAEGVILLGEICLNGICLLKSGVYHGYLGVALLEVFFNDGIVGAAEDKMFHLFAGENVIHLSAYLGVDIVLVKIAAVNQRCEQRAALTYNFDRGVVLMNELIVVLGAYGELGSDKTNALYSRFCYVIGSGRNDTDYLIVKMRGKVIHKGGNGVAGDGGDLNSVIAEEFEHILAQFGNLLGGFVAVGAVCTVAKIDYILAGENSLQLSDYRKSAYA